MDIQKPLKMLEGLRKMVRVCPEAGSYHAALDEVRTILQTGWPNMTEEEQNDMYTLVCGQFLKQSMMLLTK